MQNTKDHFPNNSFALVQHAYHLISLDKTRADVVESEKEFNKVIKLIDDDRQFRGSKGEAFRYRIKFEAILGIAYIHYLRGSYCKTDQKYREAERIIEEHFKHEERYLKSILHVNWGRNRLDSGNAKMKSKSKEDFEYVLETYKKTETEEKELKDELMEIVARAHNNLGVYYLCDGILFM